MPADQRLFFDNVETKWTSGSVAPCFIWPSYERTVTGTYSELYGPLVLVDKKNPNWKQQVIAGVSATTSRLVELRDIQYTRGNLYLGRWCPAPVNRFGYHRIEGDISDSLSLTQFPAAPTAAMSAIADAQALQRLIANARNMQGAFKGSTFMAELRDAIRGIRNPASSIRRGIDDYAAAARRNARRASGRFAVPRTQQGWRELERASPRRAGAIGRAISGTWLEYAFGWTPLANDIENVFDAMSQRNLRPPRARIRGRGVNEVASTAFLSRGYGSIEVTFEVVTTNRNSVHYYGAVKLEVDQPHKRALQEFGFTTKDFLPAVWEAIPYSFLVDYFSNIGDIVSAWSFPRSDLAWVSRTYRNARTKDSSRSTVKNIGAAYPAFGSYKVLGYTPASIILTRKKIERTDNVGSLVPRVQWEIPGSKNWRKWLNLSALSLARTL